MSDISFDSLLDSLYGVIGHFEQWYTFTEELTRFFNANACHIVSGDMVTKEYSFTINYGMTQETVVKLAELADDDPRIPMVLAVPGKVISIGPDNKAFFNCRKFQEVLLPNNFIYSMGFAYPDGTDRLLGISVLRGIEAGEFSQYDKELLSELEPHLVRVIHLQKKFLQLDEHYWQSLSILDDVNMGIIIADKQAHVLFVNQWGRDIIDKEESLNLRHGLFRSSDKRLGIDILAGISEQIEAIEQNQVLTPQSLSLVRHDKAPLLLRIQAINPDNPPFQLHKLSRPVAAVFISDPGIAEETSIELLRRMFGYTVAEARLAGNLVEGCNLNQAAESSGISKQTAHSYLKKIFAKTEVSSQAELIKRIVSSPVWLKARRE